MSIAFRNSGCSTARKERFEVIKNTTSCSLHVLSSHFTIGESIGIEKIEYIELCVESVYVKRWEGPSYREPPTTIVKAPEPGPQGLRPNFGLRI